MLFKFCYISSVFGNKDLVPLTRHYFVYIHTEWVLEFYAESIWLTPLSIKIYCNSFPDVFLNKLKNGVHKNYLIFATPSGLKVWHLKPVDHIKWHEVFVYEQLVDLDWDRDTWCECLGAVSAGMCLSHLDYDLVWVHSSGYGLFIICLFTCIAPNYIMHVHYWCLLSGGMLEIKKNSCGM